jgi:NADH-quinone oxidoreductase subunit J
VNLLFYLASSVALGAAGMAVTRKVAVHALLYLVVTYFAVALMMLLMGAAFAAVLELIVYAGAIVVMFVFVVMILNLGPASARAEAVQVTPARFAGPALLGAILLGEVSWMIAAQGEVALTEAVDTRAVGVTLWGPYLLAVELASMLLLAALVGAMHLGRRLDGVARGEGA